MTPEQRRLVLALHNYQRLTIRAALSGDRRVAVDALAANPLVPSLDVAEALLDALLNAHREHLPAFFASSGS